MNTAYDPLSPELCRTFVEMEKHSWSVTLTARALKLNEATVSKRIRPLVRGAPPYLPRPWLVKRGKRFDLTDEGRQMLVRAKEVVDWWGEFSAHASANRQPGVSVACGQEAAGGTVLRAAAGFRKLHPGAALRITIVRGRRRIEGVAGGLFDIALVTHHAVAIRELARREVRIAALADDVLMLAAAARSPWAKALDAARGDIPLDTFRDWPFVLPEADSPVRKQWDERIRRKADTPPPIALEVGGWRVIAGYILAGFGVGLLPRSVLAEFAGKLKAKPLPDALRPANRLQAVTLPKPAHAELVEAFAKLLN